VPLESGCGGWGTCASCGVHIVEASCGVPPESAGEREAKRTSSIDEDQRLACFLSVEQDLSVTTLDWGETCRGAEKSEAEEV
jgi:ferredoxin